MSETYEHWLVIGRGAEDATFIVWDTETAEEHRARGYRVDGPFVPAEQLQQALDALKTIRDHGKVEGHECWALHQGDCADVFQETARATLGSLGGAS